MSKENRVSDERTEMRVLLGKINAGRKVLQDDDTDEVFVSVDAALDAMLSLRSKPVASGAAEMQNAICQALLDAFPMDDKIADNYAAVAVKALSALLPKATAPSVSEPVATIDRAMDCDSWPKWLGDIVDLAIQASDAADMSTEQAIAYAILHYAASPQPDAVITEEMVERAYDAFVAACERSDWDEPEVRGYVRSALEAAMKEA